MLLSSRYLRWCRPVLAAAAFPGSTRPINFPFRRLGFLVPSISFLARSPSVKSARLYVPAASLSFSHGDLLLPLHDVHVHSPVSVRPSPFAIVFVSVFSRSSSSAQFTSRALGCLTLLVVPLNVRCVGDSLITQIHTSVHTPSIVQQIYLMIYCMLVS